MHCEEQLGLTRKCLEIIDRYGFGVAIQSKSTRILRDLDLLKSINEKRNAKLMHLFREKCKAYGILCEAEECFRYLREFPDKFEQLSYFNIEERKIKKTATK